MAEIQQPAPIKPTWPTRREGHPNRKKQPQGVGKRKPRDPSGKPGKDGPRRPHIDDYA